MELNLQLFGGRGASSPGSGGSSDKGGNWLSQSIAAGEAYEVAKQNYSEDYVPWMRGQVSRIDAGQVYKAAKNGDIKVSPETISTLYNETKYDWRGAIQRYSSDYIFYDDIYHTTHALLNKDYKTAQKLIKAIELYMKK